MKSLLSLAIITGLTLASCKKKSDSSQENESPATTETSTTTGITTGGTSTTPTTSATDFHGNFYLITFSTVAAGTFTPYHYCAAVFVERTYVTDKQSTNVKKVSLNGDSLLYDTLQGIKYTKILSGKPSPVIFEVIGTNTIPSFTYDATFSDPTCTNLDLFPAVISKSAGFSIILNVDNIKSGMLTLGGGGNILPYFPLSNGNNTITISASQLKDFINTTKGEIKVQISNFSAHAIGGKDFIFYKQLYFSRTVEITD